MKLKEEIAYLQGQIDEKDKTIERLYNERNNATDKALIGKYNNQLAKQTIEKYENIIEDQERELAKYRRQG